MLSAATCCIIAHAAPRLLAGVFCSSLSNLWACVLLGVLSWKLGEKMLVRWRFFFLLSCPPTFYDTDIMGNHKSRSLLVSVECRWAMLPAAAFPYHPRKPSNKLAGCCAMLLHGCLMQSSILAFKLTSVQGCVQVLSIDIDVWCGSDFGIYNSLHWQVARLNNLKL